MNTNGTRSTPKPAQLAVLDAQESPLRRGSVGTCSTQIQDGSTGDVKLDVANNILDFLRRQESLFGLDPELLDPARIGAAIQEKSISIPEFADLESASNEERSQLLRSVASGQQSRARRLLIDLAAQTVDETIQPIRQQLLRACSMAPYATRDLAERCRETVDMLRLEDVPQTKLRQLANSVRALADIDSQFSRIPNHLLEAVKISLQQATETLVDEIHQAVCQQYAVNAIRNALSTLKSLIKDCSRLASEFLQNTTALTDLLKERKRDLHHSDAVSSSSVVIPLSGPSQSNILAAMNDQERVSDSEELTLVLIKKLIARLIDLCKQRYPHIDQDAPLGAFLTRILPEDLADTISDVVDGSIGNRHTVYRSISTMGVETFVTTMFDKSGVLIRLGGYEHDRVHIAPLNQTLVLFPPRLGDDDEQIYLELRDEFLRRDAGCLIVDAGAAERNISCLRAKVGFPIAVEELNTSLLEHYANCSPHLPHLFGYTDTDGAAQPEELALFQQLTRRGDNQ